MQDKLNGNFSWQFVEKPESRCPLSHRTWNNMSKLLPQATQIEFCRFTLKLFDSLFFSSVFFCVQFQIRK